MKSTFLAGALFLLSSTAFADTYIVDDDGGPGVDYTDLATAVAGVLDGDVLLVRSGTYSAFNCQKAIAMIAVSEPVRVMDTITIQNIGAGERFGMEGVDSSGLSIVNCDGLVSVTGPGVGASIARWVSVQASFDVRLRDIDINGSSGAPAMSISASQVELVDSYVEGYTGADDYEFAEDGEHAITLSTYSIVQITRTSVQGGHGGWVSSEWTSSGWGAGGHAIEIEEGSEVILTGRESDEIRGGYEGSHDLWGGGGWLNRSIDNNGAVRHSGVSFNGYIGGPGYEESPIQPDPHLDAHMTPAGLRVSIAGAVGGNARLFIGTDARQPLSPFLIKPVMVEPVSGFALGVIGAGGSVTFNIDFALATPVMESYQLVLQGSVVAAGENVYTNSLVRMRR
jgi:hypothetical protein